MTPHWIPELVPKSPIEDFAVYEDRIYAIFRQDFIDSHPSFDGLRVSVRRQREETDGKWAGFFDPEKISKVIGPGGKMIKKIVEETGAKIDIDDIFIIENYSWHMNQINL